MIKLNLLKIMMFFSTVGVFAADITARATSASITTPVGSTTQGLRRWSNPNTWVGGVLPGPNDVAIIPANSGVLLDRNINVGGLRVNGRLIVDISRNININAEYILLNGGNGYFEWGTESERYRQQGSITLRGNNPNLRIPGTSFERKMIVVRNGAQLELHGQNKRSWTKLNATANAGARTITLQDNVNWNVGDQIVIASTDYDPLSTETARITAINGRQITLNRGLNRMHWGRIINYQGGNLPMDQRAEVGLLTRNIRIVGTNVTGANEGFNASTIITDNSSARVENVEFFRVGQRGRMGRYPFHWNEIGNGSGQYLRNCSIHESSNRIVAILSTSNLNIEGNVAYNYRGHGFFLYNGDEQLNVFRNNLSLLTRRVGEANSLTETERTEPSAFWITNPNNRFIGNVAAASEGSGFWFIPVSQILRSSSSATFSPRRFSLLEFENNTVHSCRQRGVSLEGDIRRSDREVIINNSYNLRDLNGNPLVYNFRNLTAYKCRYNVWTRASVSNRFINPRFGEAEFMAFLSFNAFISNGLFVGRNANTGTGAEHRRGLQILGLQMYNGSTDVRGLHLADFNENNEICIGTRRSSGKYPNFTASGITFENVPINRRANFTRLSLEEDPARSYSYVSGMIDLDGSITRGVTGANGTPNGRITPRITNTRISESAFANRIYNTNFNLPRDRTRFTPVPEWNAFVTTNTEYAMLQNFPGWGRNDAEEDNRFVYQMRSDGPVAFDLLRGGWDVQTPILLNENIEYAIQFHEIPNRLDSRFRWSRNRNRSIVVKYPNVPSETVVAAGATRVNTLSDLRNSSSQAYFLSDNTLYVKYVANQVDNGINTSILHQDFSARNLNIEFNPDGSDRGRDNFVTLADFEVGVDSRARLVSPGGRLNFSSITGNGTDPSDTTDSNNTFTFTNSNNGTNDVVEYRMDFDRQIWREFNTLNLNYSGSPVEVLVIDENQGRNSLGVYHPDDSRRIRLNLNPNQLDEVVGLVLRFRECSTTSNTTRITLRSIRLSISDVTSFSRRLSNICGTTPTSSVQSTEDVLLGVDTEINTSLKVFPNPFKNQLQVTPQNGSYTKASIKIYNVTGQLVHQQAFKNNEPITIATEEMLGGYYFMEMDIDGTLEKKKVIKL